MGIFFYSDVRFKYQEKKSKTYMYLNYKKIIVHLLEKSQSVITYILA